MLAAFRGSTKPIPRLSRWPWIGSHMAGVPRRFIFSIRIFLWLRSLPRLVIPTIIRANWTPKSSTACATPTSGSHNPGSLPCASVCATWASCRERRPLHGRSCAGRHHTGSPASGCRCVLRIPAAVTIHFVVALRRCVLAIWCEKPRNFDHASCKGAQAQIVVDQAVELAR